MKYESDIKLGKRYRDERTGIEGVATALIFFEHGCERADIEYAKVDADGNTEIKRESFDVPRLTEVATGKRAKTTLPGGPDRSSSGLRTRS